MTIYKLGMNICMEEGPSLLLLFLRQTRAHDTAASLPAQTGMWERCRNLTIIHDSSMDM